MSVLNQYSSYIGRSLKNTQLNNNHPIVNVAKIARQSFLEEHQLSGSVIKAISKTDDVLRSHSEDLEHYVLSIGSKPDPSNPNTETDKVMIDSNIDAGIRLRFASNYFARMIQDDRITNSKFLTTSAFMRLFDAVMLGNSAERVKGIHCPCH